MLLIEIVGWVGGLFVLVAYALLTSGRMMADSPLFQCLNLVGAAGLVVNGLGNHAYPSVAVNLVWSGIGGVSLWHITKRKARRSPPSERGRKL